MWCENLRDRWLPAECHPVKRPELPSTHPPGGVAQNDSRVHSKERPGPFVGDPRWIDSWRLSRPCSPRLKQGGNPLRVSTSRSSNRAVAGFRHSMPEARSRVLTPRKTFRCQRLRRREIFRPDSNPAVGICWLPRIVGRAQRRPLDCTDARRRQRNFPMR